jgi:ribosomal-protein-alanine N-acetyltransferase
LDQTRDAGGGIRWAICLQNSDELIGTIGFVDISKQNNSSGIGYEIHPDHWGKGIISEAVSIILEHGFNDRAFHRIWAITYPGNVASQKY